MSTEWFYLKRTGNGYIVFETADKPICAVNDEEHAQLITAAPEMLDALEVLCNFKRGCPCEVSNEEMAAWDKARAAIAKAKGGQP
jgi:hypothetical protein